jgi:hypothetical protein
MRRALALALLLSACSSKEEAPPPPPPPPAEPASASEFQRVDAGFAFGTSQLRARWDLDDKGEVDRAKMSVGDFYARLNSVFGEPSTVDDAGFSYVLRHAKTGLIITAYSAGAGPAYGGGYRVDEGAKPPQPEAALGLVAQAGREPPGFLAAVKRLESVLAAAPLAGCSITYRVEGTTLRSGARGGIAFDEALPSSEAFVHAFAAFEKAGDGGMLFDERGDRALDLWLELDDAARAQHADAGVRVAAYWASSVTRLAAEPVNEANVQVRALRWSQLWRTRAASTDERARKKLASLKPDPWPAALEALKPD